VEGADGAPLALTVWPAAGPARAVLLAVHGYGDHGARAFGDAAEVWAAAGVAVYAYDQRGFGRNPSRLAWPGEEALIADFAAVAAQIAERHPGLPLVALGHSMGGGVTLAALGEGRAPEVDGAVLMAAAVAGGAQVSALVRAGIWTLGALAPDSRFRGGGVASFRPTDDDDRLRALSSDPLHIPNPSGREILGLLRVMDRAAAAAPAVRQPVLVLHGARDELIAPGAVLAVADDIPGPVERIVYPDGWHLMLDDRQRDRVRDDILAWVLARTEGGA
jgi:alpha-beta hydrolase superfamily lysophospholipase